MASKDKSAIAQNAIMVVIGSFIPFYIAAKTVSGNWDLLTLPTTWIPKLDLKVSFLYISWYLVQCILYVLPIGGPLVPGAPLRRGHRLMYRLNGFFVLVVNILGFLFAILCGVKVSAIVDKSIELVTVAILLQVIISIGLLLQGKPSQDYNVNTEANHGDALEDWFSGRALNPRIGVLDIKFVMSRSLIIATVLYSFAVVAKCFESRNCPSTTLLLAVAMQLIYLSDAFWFESKILSIRELVHDGCGGLFCILIIGIPMEYSIVLSAIATNKHELPWYCLTSAALIFLLGYMIYTRSNNEKARYRENPYDSEFRDYDVITTFTRKNLLVSGWWGLSRHPNYFGDIIIQFSMCIMAGFGSILPYLNPILVTLMLVDRERKDYADCKRRYGEAWDRYCHRVKYRIIPFIY